MNDSLGRKIASYVVSAVVLAGATASSGEGVRYEATVLPSLDGGHTTAVAINNAGFVTGQSGSAAQSSGSHVFLWQQGTDVLSNLDASGLFERSIGQALGASSTVAGVGCSDVQGFCDGEVIRADVHGIFTTLGSLGGQVGDVTDMNDTGDIVGFWDIGNGEWHPFIVAGFSPILDINPAGGGFNRAVAINNAQQVAGFGKLDPLSGIDRAWLWEDGVTTDLGDLGSTFTFATAINENGQVVGKALTPAGRFHAFRYTDQTGMIDLQTLPEAVSSRAIAINDVGMVAGVWTTADGRQRMFRYADGEGMVDLGVTTVNGIEGEIRINNAGLVMGTAYQETGFVSFVWRPVEGVIWLEDSLTEVLGWVNVTAVDMNDSGDILITGSELIDDLFEQKSALLSLAGGVFGDSDGDGDVDLADFGNLQLCYSGPGTAFDTNGVQTHDVLVGPAFEFSQPTLTIETGDTVRWDWVGGFHNVESGVTGSHDERFRSGNPTNNTNTEFQVTFDAAFLAAQPIADDAYPYYCAVHVAIGMTGMVQVVDHPCSRFDSDGDGDVDGGDVSAFQDAFTGP